MLKGTLWGWACRIGSGALACGLLGASAAAAQPAHPHRPPPFVQTISDGALCPFPLQITYTSAEVPHAATVFGDSGTLLTGPVSVAITNADSGKTATVTQHGPVFLDNVTGGFDAFGSQLWTGESLLPVETTNGLLMFNSAFDITRLSDPHPQVVDPCALVSATPPDVTPRTTPPPWNPPTFTLSHIAYAGLFPIIGNLVRHDHNHLDVIVNGSPVTVPPGIGQAEPVDVGPAASGAGESGDMFFANVAYSPLHTHSSSGMIHLETDGQNTVFTLGQFFDEWAVRFTQTCLGPYCDGAGKSLSVYVNGVRWTGNPRDIVFGEHMEIAVVYGAPGVPAAVPSAWNGGWPDGAEGCGGAGEPSCGANGGAG